MAKKEPSAFDIYLDLREFFSSNPIKFKNLVKRLTKENSKYSLEDVLASANHHGSLYSTREIFLEFRSTFEKIFLKAKEIVPNINVNKMVSNRRSSDIESYAFLISQGAEINLKDIEYFTVQEDLNHADKYKEVVPFLTSQVDVNKIVDGSLDMFFYNKGNNHLALLLLAKRSKVPLIKTFNRFLNSYGKYRTELNEAFLSCGSVIFSFSKEDEQVLLDMGFSYGSDSCQTGSHPSNMTLWDGDKYVSISLYSGKLTGLVASFDHLTEEFWNHFKFKGNLQVKELPFAIDEIWNSGRMYV